MSIYIDECIEGSYLFVLLKSHDLPDIEPVFSRAMKDPQLATKMMVCFLGTKYSHKNAKNIFPFRNIQERAEIICDFCEFSSMINGGTIKSEFEKARYSISFLPSREKSLTVKLEITEKELSEKLSEFKHDHISLHRIHKQISKLHKRAAKLEHKLEMTRTKMARNQERVDRLGKVVEEFFPKYFA